MSKTRYIHNKTGAVGKYTVPVSFLEGTPKRKKWGGGNPRRAEIDPSFRGGLRTRKRIGQSHIDRFHKQDSTQLAEVAGDILTATGIAIVAEEGTSYRGLVGSDGGTSGTGSPVFDVVFADTTGAATVSVVENEGGNGFVATETLTIAKEDMGDNSDLTITVVSVGTAVELSAFSTHPVARVTATLAVKSGGGIADDTTTIVKASKVAGPK